jgi:hypothetical protein
VEPDGPWQRILRFVSSALASLSAVREIASFGSVAEGRADAWSDVDLFVSCDGVDRTAWLAASAIRRAKPVRYYRMFTGVPQPSGRYWFEDEQPFGRLDVSFYSADGFAAVRQAGLKEGMPVITRAEYVATRPVDHDADARLCDPWPGVEVRPEETAAGRALYQYLETLKSLRRGRREAHELEAHRLALEGVLVAGTQPAGLERLARRALEL